MKILILILLIIMSTATRVSQVRNDSDSEPSFSSQTISAIPGADNSSQVDALMAKWSQDNTPGAAIIVVRDGRVLHLKGYGLADLATKERISTKTIFDIGSVAKPFTAMAVLMLVERGKLSYADPLSKFFPEFSPDARRITIRQLLHHTSGIRDYSLVWGESKKLPGNAPRTIENAVRFLISQKQLRFQPGQRWEYSNSNYVLLAQIVSIVSGEPFLEFVRKNIFQPLGMDDSFVYNKTQAGRTGRAAAYVSHGNGFKPADRNAENYVYGDGQVNTTAEDMAKWEQTLYTEKLLKTATLKEAFASGQLEDGTPVNYGFGWGLGKYRGLRSVSHGGSTDGFVAQFTHFPEQHFTVVVLSNYEQFTPPYTIANKVADIYLAAELKPPVAAQLAPERLGDYVGRYALYDLAMKISLDGGTLWLNPPGQNKIELVPVSSDEFLIKGSNSTASIGFNRNSQGKITCLSLLYENGITLGR